MKWETKRSIGLGIGVTVVIMQGAIVIWLTAAPHAATECLALAPKVPAIVLDLDSTGSGCVPLPIDSADTTRLVTAS